VLVYAFRKQRQTAGTAIAWVADVLEAKNEIRE